MLAASPNQTDFSSNQVLAELERRHMLGESRICESILAKNPGLLQNRDAVLEMIYMEFVLCQEANRPISPDEIFARFPEYRADLEKILSVDQAFRNHAVTPIPSDTTLVGTHVNGNALYIDRKFEFDNLGDYELLEVIGRGGMGVVYRARQRTLNRLVAVKTIDMLSSLNPSAISRFRSEAEIVAKLQHPNIVQVYEVGSKLGVPFFSMELVLGGTLAQATQERPLVPTVAARIVETLARAVHYAHSQSVVHRDLKPANILLAPSDRAEAIGIPSVAQFVTLDSQRVSSGYEPKIADFGLGKFLEGAVDRSATQGMIGTPSFMAPEQIDPELASIGPASDIYSLGAILYDALTGTPPFNAATVIETIQKVRTSEVIAPSKLQSKIPRDLETICLKCLHKEPAKRYQTANELADDLQRFLAGQPILARPAGLIERNWKWARRHPSLTTLFAAVLFASIGMTLLWLRSEHSRRGEQAALERNDRLLYDRDIGLAHFEYESNRVERSREILEQTHPEYRGWEWDYLNQQNNGAIWESPKLRDQVVAADISRDGRLVAAVTNEPSENHPEAIHVWDIEKNELRWKLEGYKSAGLFDVQFSSDGTWLLTAGSVKSRGGKAGVKLWDMSNGTLNRTITTSSANVSLFSPNDKSIYVGDLDGWVTEYSLDTGALVQKYECVPKGTAPSIRAILDIEFNSDGSRMVVVSRAYDVTLWDTTTGKKLQSLGKASHGIHKVAWSPNGKMLSLAKWSGSRRLCLFQNDRIVEIDKAWGHKFDAGEFTPDGRKFVSAITGGSIEIQDASTGIAERTIRAHNGTTRAIAFDASGRFMLTAGGDNRVRVWDFAKPDRGQLETRVSYSRMSDLVISPSGRELAAAYKQTANNIPRIDIRDVSSHKVLAELLGHTKTPTCLAYSSDGKTLLSGSDDTTVRVWDPSNGKCLAVLEGHQASLLAVHSIENSRTCASVDVAGVVNVWDIDNRKIEMSWQLGAKPLSASFHPQLPVVAVACKGHGASFWGIDGKKLSVVPMEGDFSLLCFSANGKRLATVGVDSRSFVWSMDKYNRASILCEVTKQSGQIRDISFSPDGRRLISCSRDARFLISDVDTGHELLTLESSKDSDGLVCFSPDGKTICRTLTGHYRSWSIADATTVGSSESNLSLCISWHQAQADAAEKAQNWFAAKHHQDYLTILEPDVVSHVFASANSCMQLGDFTAAETRLCHCDEKVEESAQLSLLADLCSAYLGQQKWIEYHDVCQRLLDKYGNSTKVTELNTCLWYTSLDPFSNYDNNKVKRKFEALLTDRKNQKATYLSTLALCHYRNQKYREAIDCANESLKLRKGAPSPHDWMIIALCYAQLDHQLFGWIPKIIQQKLHLGRLSYNWNSSHNYVVPIDAWMKKMEEEINDTKAVSKIDYLTYKIYIPLLRREWDEITRDK